MFALQPMRTFAAVMTGKGTGAISTIQVFGDSAEDVIKKIFKPAGSKPAIFKAGKILLGTISNGDETIDQVTIGCEGEKNYAINCHGNPLIVADIMQLLRQHGANLITTEQLLSKILSAQGSLRRNSRAGWRGSRNCSAGVISLSRSTWQRKTGYSGS